MTTTGPDISVFEFLPTLDLSGPTPVLRIANESTGPNLANVKYSFQVFAQNGVSFHSGDMTFVTPDKTGLWVTYTIPEAIPLINNVLNFGSVGIKIIGAVKDSAGNIFTHPNVFTVAGLPPNNNGADNFAGASLSYEVQCQTAEILIQDLTTYRYMNVTGTVESKSFKLIDPDGEAQTFATNNNILVPITVNGNGYQLIFEAIVLFSFPNHTQIRLKYKFRSTFAVLCNADLCSVGHVLKQYENNSSCEVQTLRDHLLILSKAIRAVMGVMQPLCKVDMSGLLNEIYQLAGYDSLPEIVTSNIVINSNSSGDGGGTPPGGAGQIELSGGNIID